LVDWVVDLDWKFFYKEVVFKLFVIPSDVHVGDLAQYLYTYMNLNLWSNGSSLAIYYSVPIIRDSLNKGDWVYFVGDEVLGVRASIRGGSVRSVGTRRFLFPDDPVSDDAINKIKRWALGLRVIVLPSSMVLEHPVDFQTLNTLSLARLGDRFREYQRVVDAYRREDG
jgi:hypothetical protein